MRSAAMWLSWAGQWGKTMKTLRLLTGIALFVFALPAFAACPKRGERLSHDFKFHTGETLAELKLHYTTVGDPAGIPVIVLHGTSGSAVGRLTARLLPPESSAVEVVSREVGGSVATLERWRAEALANGPGGGSQRWTAAARLQAVIATAAMDEATRSAWSREQGLYPAELDAWKQDAIAGLGEPRAASAVEARQDRRRVKELERELHRKDKALAETAALLVLSKKLAAVFNDGEDV
jgi:transposase